MLNYLGGRFHRRKETWKSRDKILNTGTYTIIGYNWDLEQEEKNNDDEEETSLVLKRSMRNMGLLWSSWECYCMVGGEWEFKTRRWALLLIEFIREGDRHLKRETAKTCSNNCITWKEHCNTFGFNYLLKGKNQYRCVCVHCQSDYLWPMNFRPQDSSVHGIFQARILEWVAMAYSRGWFQRRDGTRVSTCALQVNS